MGIEQLSEERIRLLREVVSGEVSVRQFGFSRNDVVLEVAYNVATQRKPDLIDVAQMTGDDMLCLQDLGDIIIRRAEVELGMIPHPRLHA